MEIRKYIKEQDEERLMRLIASEGEEWECYTGEDVAEKYRKALNASITYVAYQEGILCGYSRSIDDCGFYIYVCDLLVDRNHRGKNIGRKLMESIYLDYPDKIVYVMSDVDGYYEKQGYRREGSIFEVRKRPIE
ncbi:GNAT family N-acetyltransferase [Alkalibacter saccharofermentans]|uniref:Acetyltransferase (GNAT) domain-containing protein n=1 Tax=Alkalibacter saccharofermentans DSM 14828 TaxID=1120975 RepID=A0A1M4WDP1_9FIRM|nr:GNAT family N-acetyltransferase [Alkalibacter saccharofermentans]SHE79359.1 Acetyltransferase (GNAT) domain-containing protein [Alkalibacter saccharofermentans DSM 14828]